MTPKFGLDFQVTGGATLELWTRTIDDVIAPGELCVTLFTRTELLSALGLPLPPLDVPVVNAQTGNAYFTASRTTWPRGQWADDPDPDDVRAGRRSRRAAGSASRSGCAAAARPATT